jgi:hypothetical protein
VYRVDRRALALAPVFFAVFLLGVLRAGKGDPPAPPRPSTLIPAADLAPAPGTGEGDRPEGRGTQPARAGWPSTLLSLAGRAEENNKKRACPSRARARGGKDS